SFIVQFSPDYNKAVKKARAAIKQDIQNYLEGEFCYISITAYDGEEEIARDSRGGCDSDYVTSGLAFYEQCQESSIEEEVKKYLFEKDFSENARFYMCGNFNTSEELKG